MALFERWVANCSRCEEQLSWRRGGWRTLCCMLAGWAV